MSKLKFFLALLFVLFFSTIVFAVDTNYSCSNYSNGLSRLRGDIDGDGKITMSDYEIAVKMQEGTIAIPVEKCCIYFPTAANPDPRIVTSASGIKYYLEGVWTEAGSCANPIHQRLIKYNCNDYSTGSSRLRGDIDGDGKVTSADASIISSIAYDNIAGPINSCCVDLVKTQDIKIVNGVEVDVPVTLDDWRIVNNIFSGTLSGAGTCAQPIEPVSNTNPSQDGPSCGKGTVSYSKAKSIALSVCGELDGESYCNEGTNTWWFDLALKKEGCSPACVVDSLTGNAEINYRCTGVIVDPVKPIACTLEYAPVCGEKKVQCVRAPCNPIKQTYGNKCMAKADEATILYEGECRVDNSDDDCACTKEFIPVCGFSSKENYKTTYANKCVARCAKVDYFTEGMCKGDCPQYAPPYCPNGKIDSVIDEKGCSKPVCVKNSEQHYKGAYWECSDGTQGKEYDSCMPYSFWKQYARRKCTYVKGCQPDFDINRITTAPQQTTQQNVVGVIGNFILNTVTGVASSVRPTQTTPSTTDANVDVNECVGNENVYLTNFVPLEECDPRDKVCEYGYKDGCKVKKCTDGEYEINCEKQECKYYLDEQGCKVKACINGETEIACPSNPEKPWRSEHLYKSAEWSCYSGKKFQHNLDSCIDYSDWKEKAIASCENQCSLDSNQNFSSEKNECGVNSFAVYDSCNEKKEPVICSAQTFEQVKELKTKCYANNMDVVISLDSQGCREYHCKEKKKDNGCLKIEDVPKEKKLYCEERGGTFVVKENSDGCIAVLECAGEKIADENKEINQSILSDKTKLLDFALKLESVRMELDSVKTKIQAIADYYSGKGDANRAAKYEKAVGLVDQAIEQVDEVKAYIKENIDSMDEEKARIIRERVRTIKEKGLKEVLLALLE